MGSFCNQQFYQGLSSLALPAPSIQKTEFLKWHLCRNESCMYFQVGTKTLLLKNFLEAFNITIHIYNSNVVYKDPKTVHPDGIRTHLIAYIHMYAFVGIHMHLIAYIHMYAFVGIHMHLIAYIHTYVRSSVLEADAMTSMPGRSCYWTKKKWLN
jgi:hypothetical protein